VAKIQAGGRKLMYGSYLGGNADELSGSIGLDARDNVYVFNQSASRNFPITPDALFSLPTGSPFTPTLTRISNVHIDSLGGYNPATSVFTLRNGTQETSVALGNPGDIPVIGDWDGDGDDTIGVFRDGTWTLSNENVNPVPFQVFLGVAGDIPVVGDWNNDGRDTVGVFRAGIPGFLLTNDNITVDEIVPFGQFGDTPLAGDWDGDGDDDIGVFRAGTFFLDLNLTGVVAELTANFGAATDLPFVGDWDGDGAMTIGVLHPVGRSNVFQLRNSITTGAADLTVNASPLVTPLGLAGIRPLAGDYDGLP
jgi:hypothetical protein